MDDLISRKAVIQMFNSADRYVADSLRICDTDKQFPQNEVFIVDDMYEGLEQLPSAQPEEVIPHRNYKYLSDYWCACGWHLGKKGEVKYCADCGRKVKWDD